MRTTERDTTRMRRSAVFGISDGIRIGVNSGSSRSLHSQHPHAMRKRRNEMAIRLLPILSLLNVSFAFVQQGSNGMEQATSTRLFYHFMEPTDGSELSPELGKLDQARQHFEKLMWHHTQADKKKVLTSNERRKKEQEISLLQQLVDSNNAVDDLVHLWTTESDEEAAKTLTRMQGVCSDGLVEEEKALRQMCEKYDTWAEPFSRLATLLFYKREFSEAIEMAERAATLKPWHFEVLEISGLLSQQEIEDETLLEKANHLAKKALPKLEDDDRTKWVARAIFEAQKQLEDAEVVTAIFQRTFVELSEAEIWQ